MSPLTRRMMYPSMYPEVSHADWCWQSDNMPDSVFRTSWSERKMLPPSQPPQRPRSSSRTWASPPKIPGSGSARYVTFWLVSSHPGCSELRLRCHVNAARVFPSCTPLAPGTFALLRRSIFDPFLAVRSTTGSTKSTQTRLRPRRYSDLDIISPDFLRPLPPTPPSPSHTVWSMLRCWIFHADW